VVERLDVCWARQLPEAVRALEWQPSGGQLAAGTLAGDVVTISASGELQLAAQLSQDVLAVGWSCDGDWLAAGGRKGRLDMWQGGVDAIA